MIIDRDQLRRLDTGYTAVLTDPQLPGHLRGTLQTRADQVHEQLRDLDPAEQGIAARCPSYAHQGNGYAICGTELTGQGECPDQARHAAA